MTARLTPRESDPTILQRRVNAANRPAPHNTRRANPVNDAKLIEMLTTDLRTGGHWLGDMIRNWTDNEVLAASGVVHHWRHQIDRDLTRRAAGQTENCPSVETPASTLPDRLRGDGPCQNCSTSDNIVWFTESVLWNEVMGADGGILCIACFVAEVDKAGLRPTGWRLLPDWHWETHAEHRSRLAGENTQEA